MMGVKIQNGEIIQNCIVLVSWSMYFYKIYVQKTGKGLAWHLILTLGYYIRGGLSSWEEDP